MRFGPELNLKNMINVPREILGGASRETSETSLKDILRKASGFSQRLIHFFWFFMFCTCSSCIFSQRIFSDFIQMISQNFSQNTSWVAPADSTKSFPQRFLVSFLQNCSRDVSKIFSWYFFCSHIKRFTRNVGNLESIHDFSYRFFYLFASKCLSDIFPVLHISSMDNPRCSWSSNRNFTLTFFLFPSVFIFKVVPFFREEFLKKPKSYLQAKSHWKLRQKRRYTNLKKF